MKYDAGLSSIGVFHNWLFGTSGAPVTSSHGAVASTDTTATKPGVAREATLPIAKRSVMKL